MAVTNLTGTSWLINEYVPFTRDVYEFDLNLGAKDTLIFNLLFLRQDTHFQTKLAFHTTIGTGEHILLAMAYTTGSKVLDAGQINCGELLILQTEMTPQTQQR